MTFKVYFNSHQCTLGFVMSMLEGSETFHTIKDWILSMSAFPWPQQKLGK